MTDETRFKRMPRQMRRLLLFGAALVSLVLIGAACSSDSSSNDTTPKDDGAVEQEVPSGTDSNTTGIEVAGGEEVLFVYSGADELGGEELTLAEVFEQGKPVVLNFWAGLCPPCRQEMPDFQEVYSERKDEFLLLGVDVGPFTFLGDQGDALDLIEELQISYPTAYVDSDTLMREYNVFGMPTTVFMTADGDIVSQKNGFMSGEEMRDRIQQMIDESQ